MSKAFRPLLRHGARRGLPTKAGFSRGNSDGSGTPAGAGANGVSRRDVLRFGARGLAAALLAPGLGTLAGGCTVGRPPGPARSNARKKTVIVVGAGFSGLACADTLVHGGMNVVVLEATARPGGRVRTDRAFIPGDSVELGGEWIGRNHPTWLAYAQEFNLRLEEPGAAPEPEGVGDAKETTTRPATGESTTQPTGTDGAPSDQPGNAVPRPEPFETEMDAPAGQPGASGDASQRSDLRLALFAQPADQTETPPADAQPVDPQPTDAPPTDPALAPAPDAPPTDAAAQPAPTPAPADGVPAETAPATQPATTTPAGEEDEPIILRGRLIRGEAADRLYEEVDAVLARLIEMARNVDPVRPWTSPDAAELDRKSFAAFLDEQQGLGDDARALLRSAAETDNGVVPERMSLLAYLSMVAGGGLQAYFEDSEVYRLADGNDALATALAQKLGNRVHYNSAVDLVRREADGVIVRTRNGAVHRGDAVVVTVPPSVWQRVQLLPPMSQAVTPQMGENVKLILALRDAVWERQGLTPELTSDGLVGMTWAATDPLTRGPVALTLFSGGNAAEQLRRLLPELRDRQAIDSVAPAYPDLPAAVVRSRFVDWPGMPLTRASYSFPAPGEVVLYGPMLVDGITSDGLAPLMFAGEHTAYGFIGYMEGALSSGVRIARALIGATTSATVTATAPAATMPAETQPATQPVETTLPTDTAPAEPVPAPTDTVPTEPAPAEPAPAETQPPPAETVPEEPAGVDA